MGHSTAVIYVSSSSVSERSTSYEVMREAVELWRETEAGRWDDAWDDGGSSPIEAPMSREVADRAAHIGVCSDVSRIIPVVEEYQEKSEIVHLEVSAAEMKSLRSGDGWNLFEEGRLGENVVSYEIDKLPKARAPRAVTTEGKAETRYRVLVGAYVPHGLESSYATQALARAAAMEYIKEHEQIDRIAVEAFVQRDTGDKALVCITRSENEVSKISMRVTRHIPKPLSPIVGYVVAFDYHH